MFRAFWSDDAGVAAIEYSLIAALVLVTALGAMDHTGNTVSTSIWAVVGAITFGPP